MSPDRSSPGAAAAGSAAARDAPASAPRTSRLFRLLSDGMAMPSQEEIITRVTITRMTPEVVQEAPAAYPPFTAEHDLIRQTVKRFAREQIAPFAQEWDEAGIFPRELFGKAAGLGLFGVRIPTELGGSGLDWWATAAALEGLSWSDSPGANMGLMVQGELTIPIIAELGTPEQQEIFLKPALAGEWIGALGISEPGGGSDGAGLRTHPPAGGGEP